MLRKPLNILFAFIFVCAAFLSVNAQGSDASTSSGRPSSNELDMPESFKENLAKQRIKNEEKEYQELVQRGEEAAKLGAEISKSWETSQKFSTEDEKKLDRLEKLVKKIRTELGAEGEVEGEEKNKIEIEKPSTFQKVIKNIQEDAANLLSEIKKIGRHSISVIAIESSNTLLKLVRFLRFNSK
jgi:uncharacterized protein YlxW (UPF0749 family)